MSHVLSQTSSVGVATSEAFWPRTVSRDERSEWWLSRTASDLEDAARAWNPPFEVGHHAIKEKLLCAPRLVVLANDELVAGFVSVTETRRLWRSGLQARYLEGVIVHPSIGGPGKFSQLMDVAGERAEVEILHTQSPQMLAGVKSRSQGIFPDPELLNGMQDDLYADIRELLKEIGRERTDFDPITGIVQGLYGHCLYGSWPLPGHEKALTFRELDPASGVLVAGFATAATARNWMMPVGQEARR